MDGIDTRTHGVGSRSTPRRRQATQRTGAGREPGAVDASGTARLRAFAAQLAGLERIQRVEPMLLGELTVRLRGWRADSTLRLTWTPEGGLHAVSHDFVAPVRDSTSREPAIVSVRLAPTEPDGPQVSGAPGRAARHVRHDDRVDRYFARLLPQLSHAARDALLDAGGAADSDAFDPVFWMRDRLGAFVMTHARALNRDEHIKPWLCTLPVATRDFEQERVAFETQVERVARGPGINGRGAMWLLVGHACLGVATLANHALTRRGTAPPIGGGNGTGVLGRTLASSVESASTTDRTRIAVRRPRSAESPHGAPAADRTPTGMSRLGAAFVQASLKITQGGQRDISRRSKTLDARALGALREASCDSTESPCDLREAFARGVAKALGDYGARADDALSPHGVSSLIQHAIDLAAFGQAFSSVFELARGALVEAARTRATFESLRMTISASYADALGLDPGLAKWVGRACLSHAHSVVAREDVDLATIFGSLEWVDLQLGSDLARASGRDPLKLTPANLIALANGADVAIREGLLNATDWMQPAGDVAVFHALYCGELGVDGMHKWTAIHTSKQRNATGAPLAQDVARARVASRALPDRVAQIRAIEVLAASLDTRWKHVGELISGLDTVARNVAARPAERRGLARSLLQARLKSALRWTPAWIEPRVENYMSYPDGRTFEIAVPNLDTLYRDRWDRWQTRLAGNLTRLIAARVRLSRAQDVFERIHHRECRNVQILVPRLHCELAPVHAGPEWLRELWRSEYVARDGAAVVAIDWGALDPDIPNGEGFREYWSVVAGELFEDLTSLSARPSVRAHSTELRMFVTSMRHRIFDAEACRGIAQILLNGSCEVAVRAWTPSSASTLPHALLAAWIAAELAKVGHAHGYDLLWRQRWEAPLKAMVQSFVPLLDLVEAIKDGHSPAIGIAIVNNALMLTAIGRPAMTIVRGASSLSKATAAMLVLGDAVRKIRAGANVAAAVGAAVADPSALRLFAMSRFYGRALAKELGKATLSVIDPGIEDLVTWGTRMTPILGRTIERMGAGLRAAYRKAQAAHARQALLSVRAAGRKPANLEMLSVEGQRIAVMRDTRRPNGLFHYFAIDPEDGLARGARFSIDANQRIVDAPRPPDQIPLVRARHRDRLGARIPRDIRVECVPALEARRSGNPVVRIDERFYEIIVGDKAARLARVGDVRVGDVRVGDMRVGDMRGHDDVVGAKRPGTHGGPQYTIDVTGTREHPLLSVERDSGLQLGEGVLATDVWFAHALKRFEIASTEGMQRATVDASGMLMHDGRRYVTIDGKYYFVVRDTDGVRICLDNARWKPCLPVRFDGSTQRWTLEDGRGLRGGAGDEPVRIEAIVSMCRRELPEPAAVYVREALERRESILDLGEYALPNVPDFVRHIPWLRTLILRPSGDLFVIEPAALTGVRELRLVQADCGTISMSRPSAQLEKDCWLETLEVSDSTQLVELSVQGYPVGTLSTSRLPRLARITVRDAQLERIRVKDSASLERLDLRRNALNDYRIELLSTDDDVAGEAVQGLQRSACPRLTHISLEANRLIRVPDAIRGLPGVTHLDLSQNRLISIDGLQSLRRLKAIGVSGNQLESIDALRRNMALERVACAHNRLHSIDAIRFLPRLIDIDVSANVLVHFPQPQLNRENIRSYLLTDNVIPEVPAYIVDFRSLETLSLADNVIRALPQEIGACERLQSLYLGENLLTELPVTMSGLSRLHTLAVTNNLLTELPAWIGRLPKLTFLYAARNKIHRIAAAMPGPSLSDVDLSHNPLRVLPRAFRAPDSLPSLEHPILASTQITDVSGISARAWLAVLDLSDNPLETVPAELSELRNLVWLNLEQCGLNTLPAVLETMDPQTVVRIIDGNALPLALVRTLREGSVPARRGASIATEAYPPRSPRTDFSSVVGGTSIFY